MGSCQCSSTNVKKPIRETNAPQPYSPYQFDRTVIPEMQPQPVKVHSNTAGDRLVAQLKPSVTNLLDEYDQALKALNNTNLFEDRNFPPNRQSISKDVKYKADRDITWKRPNQFLPQGEIRVFDKIEPCDIKQGALGDCYFLSSLSALAEIPSQIEKLFITKEYQQNGLYGIYMCHNGLMKQIALDDQIPCHLQNGPIFSKTNGNELWVILLEKAYAKMYGSYHNIESGLSSCALKDLTGAPSEYFIRRGETLSDADQCWKFLEKYVPLNYILTASSEINDQGVEYQKDNGIVSQHCYAILDIQTVKGSDNIQDRIIQIRNPWGRKEWTKDWSDASHKWTPQLRQSLKVEKKDDGIFWISVRDFIQEFSQVCVCKFLPNYLYTSSELTQHHGEQITRKVLLMRVYKQMKGFISVVQKDKRHFDKHQYSLARVIIGLIDPHSNQVITYQGNSMDNERDVVVESTFQAGDYAIYIEVDWNQNYDRYLAVSSYGEDSVQFTEMDVTDQVKDNLLDGLLRVHEKFTEEEKVKDYGEGIKRISGLVAGYIYYWYQNNSTKSLLKEEIVMNNRKYLDICLPYRDSDKFTVEVRPQDNILVKYRVNKAGNGSFGYSLQSTNQLIHHKSDQEIIQLATRKPDKVLQRQINGQNIEVYLNIVTFPSGMGLLFMNQTRQTYKERLKLNVINLAGINFDVNSAIQLTITAGKSQLLTLKIIDPAQQCHYDLNEEYHLE